MSVALRTMTAESGTAVTCACLRKRAQENSALNVAAVTKFISLLPSGVNDRCSSTTYRDDGTRIM